MSAKAYPCPHCGEPFGSLEGYQAHEPSCGKRDAGSVVVVEPVVETVVTVDEVVPAPSRRAAIPSATELTKLSRAELDEIAERLELDPAGFRNKAEAISAILEAAD